MSTSIRLKTKRIGTVPGQPQILSHLLRGAAAAVGATHHHNARTQRLPPLPYVVPNPKLPRGPPPNMDWMDSQDPPTLNTCHNDFTDVPTTLLAHSVTECREHYLQQIDPISGTFGEFNLPKQRSVKFPAAESDDEWFERSYGF